MMDITRRWIFAAGGASLVLSACAGGIEGNGVGSDGAAEIDARVDASRDYLLQNHAGTQDLVSRAAGILYMPLVTEAGFIFGGAFGRGALRIGGATVDYYSATRASVGLQIGAQQFAHALFFMTESALADFRSGSGWAASADLRYATFTDGASAGKQTNELGEVIALVYGQQGLIAGASLAGTKYTRIIP
ncbi:MAG: YSC84-related protein [Paracoccaceae bacterium]